MPSADFCMAIRTPYDDLSLKYQTPHRPPEVSYTAFTAQLPDLLPECPNEYGTSSSHADSSSRRQPHIRFLFVSSQFCSTLPSACTSRYKPCASLVLRPHLAGQGTFTPKLCNMLGTHEKHPTYVGCLVEVTVDACADIGSLVQPKLSETA